jgi:molybdate transport system substrate-binding protein
MIRIWRGFFLAAAVALGLGGAASAQDKGLTVFAAASLKNALDDVDGAFTKKTGVSVSASYAGSSTLARQIEQGAQADVFVSADVDWMDYVAKKNLVQTGTRRDLLTNRLALVAPKDSTVKLTIGRDMPLAQTLGSSKLVMANLDVPAGRYGKAALTFLGVWPSVQDKVAFGENVRAALQFVSRGEAALGIVYDTDAMVDPNVRIVDLFPEDSHPKIVYPAAVIAGSKSPSAGPYVTFLSSAEAGAIFRKYGFKLLSR